MPSLASKFVDDFRIGCVIDGDLSQKYTEAERRLVVEHHNAITIENSLKAHRVHPAEDRYEFAVPDAICDFAEQHRLEMTGHCLLWHQSYPEWFFAGDRAAVLGRIGDHIRTVLGHYRGRMRGWDVVNEAISDKADEWLRPSDFTRAIGEDFVVRAFELAHEADPDVGMYYNDYSIEMPAKRDRALKLLRQIQSAGCRIDAVGIQGHFVRGKVPLRELEEAIVAYHALGLKVMVTELDIDVYPRDTSGADVSWTQSAGADAATCPPDLLHRQAEDYAGVFDVLRRHRDKVTRVTFWGLHDGHNWLNNWPVRGRTNHALLFDRQCRPKPAYDAVMRL